MKMPGTICLVAAILATGPAVGAERNDASPLANATIELPLTDNLVTFEVQMTSGRTFTLRAREGSMIMLTNDADVTLRFVVARDAATNSRFVLRQVIAREKTIDGVVHPLLFVDVPVEFGALSPNLEAAGVASTALLAVSKISAS